MNFKEYLREYFETDEEIEAHNLEQFKNAGDRKRQNHAEFPRQFIEGTRIARKLGDKYNVPLVYDYWDDFSNNFAITINDINRGTSFHAKDEKDAEIKLLKKLEGFAEASRKKLINKNKG